MMTVDDWISNIFPLFAICIIIKRERPELGDGTKYLEWKIKYKSRRVL